MELTTACLYCSMMIGACSFQPVSASCSLPIYTPATPPCRPGFPQLSPLDLLIFRHSLVLKRGFETSKRDQVVFPVLDAKYVTQNAQNVLLTMSSVCIRVFCVCLHRPTCLEACFCLCLYLCLCSSVYINLLGWELSFVCVCI